MAHVMQFNFSFCLISLRNDRCSTLLVLDLVTENVLFFLDEHCKHLASDEVKESLAKLWGRMRFCSK